MHSGARKICFIVNPVSGGKDKSAIVARIARELDPAVGREFRAGNVTRERVRRQSAQTALDLVRRYLTGLLD